MTINNLDIFYFLYNCIDKNKQGIIKIGNWIHVPNTNPLYN